MLSPQRHIKRSRASKPKVKTGCRTCKARRVKCDEKRPQCQKCLSTGRNCEGYEVSKSSINPIIRPLHPKEPNVPGRLTQVRPSLPGFSDTTPLEKQCFYFFQQRTARELPGLFSLDLCERLVLQISSSEPAILHAAIAVSSIHQRYEASGMAITVDNLVDERYRFALNQYNKALSFLKRRLDGSDQCSTEIILTTCFLFICLEMLQGHYDAATTHLQNGLNILCDRQRQNTQILGDALISPPNPQSILENLIDSFARLDLQSTFFGQITPHSYLVTENGASEDQFRLPESFNSVSEAKRYLDSHMNAIFRLVWPELNSDRNSLDLAILLARQKELQVRGQRWKATFDLFLCSRSYGLNDKDLRASTLLRIYHLTMSIILASGFSAAIEAVFDTFTSSFQTIVSLAASLAAQGSQDNRIPSFSLDMGIIPPLYYTIIKCRHPRIRRQALAILKSSPHREGMWDSAMACKVAEQVVAIEESNLEKPPEYEGDIPESARIYRILVKDSDDDNIIPTIVCRRVRHEIGGQEWEVWEEPFPSSRVDLPSRITTNNAE
ncbi:MAG: hypothetical protein M1834_003884 [Cirrosporium novae-zelandiae]|nr:MAG: hypothetical protein M1834_003884 [Cirrosporium novae-zelandiae]